MRQKLFQRFVRRMKAMMLNTLPGMISCREFDQFVVDYLDGRLPDHQQHLFERHLRVCPDRRRFLDRYRATLALEQDAFNGGENGLVRCRKP